MSNKDEIRIAIENVDKILDKGKEIIAVTPHLNSFKQTLTWYQSAGSILGDNVSDQIMDSVRLFNSMPSENSIFSDTTGSLALSVSATASTANILTNLGERAKPFVLSFKELNKTEELMNQMENKFEQINIELAERFKIIKHDYNQWKAGLLDGPKLIMETRHFGYLFKGVLHKDRVPNAKMNDKGKYSDFSWDKIYESIGKPGAKYKQAFLIEKNKYLELHSDHSKNGKRNSELTADETEDSFDRFIKNIFTITNLIDEKHFNN